MAQRGVEIQVLERGVPIARLVGMSDRPQADEVGLERLVKAGIVRRGEGRVRAISRKRLSVAPRLLEAIDEDREDRA